MYDPVWSGDTLATLNFTCTPRTLFLISAPWPHPPPSPSPTHTQCLARHLLTIATCLVPLKDAVPLGEIILGANGFHVDENLPEKLEHHANIFMLHVPNRQGGGFPLMAESADSRKSWMKAIRGIIEECGGSPDLCSSTGKFTYENETDEEKDDEKDDESDSFPSPLSP